MLFRKPSIPRGTNMLTLVPERLFGHDSADDGIVTVDMPRFHVAWMQRLLVPRRRHPFIRIKLDRFGSDAWLLIDGARTVGDIADELDRRFGAEVQPVHDRLGTFMQLLERRGFVRFTNIGAAAPPR
jgi:hypothetical protein